MSRINETEEERQTRVNAKQGVIYRFEVDGGLFYYIGQTKLTMEDRFKQHKRSCLGLDPRHIDNSRKYVIMRQLGINADNFDERVKCKVIVICRLDEIDYYENLHITIGSQSLNTQHSLRYLDGYYTKNYMEKGTLGDYTEEEKVIRHCKIVSEYFKLIKKKHYCECCDYHCGRIDDMNRHKKTIKHSTNELMWID